MTRNARITRQTGETRIELVLDLDGSGRAEVTTGVGFFDHMLTLLARHSLIDLQVQADGDLHVDAHHTVEDVGLCYGQALAQALGDKAGIRRYGSATLPMDEVLVTTAIDLSGRPFCVWQADMPLETLGNFSASLGEDFWRAVSSSGAVQSAHRVSPWPQYPSHPRGDLQGHRPGLAAGRGTRSAHDRNSLDQGSALKLQRVLWRHVGNVPRIFGTLPTCRHRECYPPSLLRLMENIVRWKVRETTPPAGVNKSR